MAKLMEANPYIKQIPQANSDNEFLIINKSDMKWIGLLKACAYNIAPNTFILIFIHQT